MRMKERAEELNKIFEEVMKLKKQGAVWTNKDLRDEMNKRIKQCYKLNGRQLGHFLGRFKAKKYKMFRHYDRYVEYVFMRK